MKQGKNTAAFKSAIFIAASAFFARNANIFRISSIII